VATEFSRNLRAVTAKALADGILAARSPKP